MFLIFLCEKKTKTLVYEICKSLDSVFLYIWHNVPTFLWIKYRNMEVCCNSVTVKLSKEDSLNLTLLRRPWAVCYIRKMHDAQTNLCPVFLYLWQFYNCTIIFQIDKMHLRRRRRSMRTNKHQFLPSSCRGFELHVISSSSACAVLWMTSCAIVFYVE